jgi:hypothetical protein
MQTGIHATKAGIAAGTTFITGVGFGAGVGKSCSKAIHSQTYLEVLTVWLCKTHTTQMSHLRYTQIQYKPATGGSKLQLGARGW